MLAGVAAIAGVVGTGLQMFSSFKQAAAQKKALKAEERARKLAAMRERREIIRQRQVAMAQAQQGGVNAGAAQSSALAGVWLVTYNQAGRNVQANLGNDSAGSKIYKANMDYASWGQISTIGAGISQVPGMISGIAETATRTFG